MDWLIVIVLFAFPPTRNLLLFLFFRGGYLCVQVLAFLVTLPGESHEQPDENSGDRGAD